ncbi:RloB family protein [Bacteroides sp. 519]|uniref:RloB family protein n=1 Tax=Bacteroides sp. 519 TaxID=2302937 RepID=UPI0013D05AF6|nr:RloB family protein [Bacteroides sp. 519]NDV60595.1 RloB domain-containing protein [Bacteroides sp. 519]
MINPWELKTDNDRTADRLYTFIVFCEDQVSESIYIKCFETENIKINTITNQKSMFDNVMRTLDYCRNNDILKKNNDAYYLDADSIEIWCVFDRDTSHDGTITDASKMSLEDLAFDESIQLAQRNGINVAWSNDAFELWILLHLEDVDPCDTQTHHRTYYYNRLTDLFANLENPPQDLVKLMQYVTLSYKKDLKREKHFPNIVLPIITPYISVAVERAKNLQEFHDVNTSHCEKKPCTLMHHLIESIRLKGGKDWTLD